MKSRITKVLAIACVFALLVGSFAYFTDRVSFSTDKNKSGNVQIEATAFAGASEDGILVDRDGFNNLNPGDYRDLTFKVTNEGNKAVDLRHIMKLTVLNGKGAAMALTEEDGQAEFDIYLKDDVTYDPVAGYKILNDAKPVFSTSDYDAKGNGVKREINAAAGTITYHYGTTTLLGKFVDAENTNNAERKADASESEKNIVIGTNKDEVTYEYVLLYRDTTENRFMDCTIQIDLVVEAKQHYNTDGDWTKVVDKSFTAGNLTLEKSVADRANDDADLAADANVGINGLPAHEDIVGEATKNVEPKTAPVQP